MERRRLRLRLFLLQPRAKFFGVVKILNWRIAFETGERHGAVLPTLCSFFRRCARFSAVVLVSSPSCSLRRRCTRFAAGVLVSAAVVLVSEEIRMGECSSTTSVGEMYDTATTAFVGHDLRRYHPWSTTSTASNCEKTSSQKLQQHT